MHAINLPAKAGPRATLGDIAAFPAGYLRDRMFALLAEDPNAPLPMLISRAAAEAAAGFETTIRGIEAELAAGKRHLAELTEYLAAIERQLKPHIAAAQAKASELKQLAAAAAQ